MNKNEFLVISSEADMRLDKWLAAAERLASRRRAFAALERGQIFVNDAEQSAADAGRKLQGGDKVRLWIDRPGSAQRRSYASSESKSTGKHRDGLHILYEDESLIVLDKPAGLLTVPLPRQPDEPSLQALVELHVKQAKALAVHRLDRDTSGIVAFAKSFQVQQKLKDQFISRSPERVYWAFVYGTLEPEQGEWRDQLVWDQEELSQREPKLGDDHRNMAHEAISRYRVIKNFQDASLLEIQLVTGKRNQIRVQAAQRGHQLIGERQYSSKPAPKILIECPRQALHALRLIIKHPVDGRRLEFTAPLPADLERLQMRLAA